SDDAHATEPAAVDLHRTTTRAGVVPIINNKSTAFDGCPSRVAVRIAENQLACPNFGQGSIRATKKAGVMDLAGKIRAQIVATNSQIPAGQENIPVTFNGANGYAPCIQK